LLNSRALINAEHNELGDNDILEMVAGTSDHVPMPGTRVCSQNFVSLLEMTNARNQEAGSVLALLLLALLLPLF
jgi:hypothetical protein